VTRAEKVWDLNTRCARASELLFLDHGRVLKRVFREPSAVEGIARPTKLMLADVLLAWEWVYKKTADRRDDDEDAKEVFREIAAQIKARWDRNADDLTQQSDDVVNLLAAHLLADIPRAKRSRT
jgi:hypothetical protein